MNKKDIFMDWEFNKVMDDERLIDKILDDKLILKQRKQSDYNLSASKN